MARYKIPNKSFINDSIVEAGAVIEYNGKFPGSDWEKLEDPRESKPTLAPKPQQPQRGR